MSRITLIFIGMSLLLACGHSPSQTEKKEMQDIKTVKTNAHVNISGTRIYIIPPAGFTISKSFAGLQNKSILIQIQEFTGIVHKESTAAFSKKGYEARGIKIAAYSTLKVNGYLAEYTEVIEDGKNKQVSLIFGNDDFSAMIVASYPQEDVQMEQAVQETLQTLYLIN